MSEDLARSILGLGATRYAILAFALALAPPAVADTTIFLDFGNFDLGLFTQNGATCASEALVEDLVVAHTARAYAPFEVHVTRVAPTRGRYTKVDVGGYADGNLGITYNGGDWLSERVTEASVDTSFHAQSPALQGSLGTCGRIAQSVAGTVIHEVGHVFWLNHYMAHDNCPTNMSGGTDPNVQYHLVAGGATGMTGEERATLRRYPGRNCEGWIVSEELKPRSYYAALPNIRGGAQYSDLLAIQLVDVDTASAFGFQSNGAVLQAPTSYATDVGSAETQFYSVDYNGDGFEDLLAGANAGISLHWWMYRNNGTGGLVLDHYVGAFGQRGDIFRTGDFNGDGNEDFIRGQFVTGSEVSTMDWFVRLRASSSWQAESLVCSGCGNGAAQTFFLDIDEDGDVDLVNGLPDGSSNALRRRLHPGCLESCEGAQGCEAECTMPVKYRWYRRYSSGVILGPSVEITPAFYYTGFRTSLPLFGDVDSDGDPDLTYGVITPSESPATEPRWERHLTHDVNRTFGQGYTLTSAAGPRGSYFRSGDLNGDGNFDLLYGVPIPGVAPNQAEGPTVWYSRIGDGIGLGLSNPTLILNSSGPSGRIYP